MVDDLEMLIQHSLAVGINPQNNENWLRGFAFSLSLKVTMPNLLFLVNYTACDISERECVCCVDAFRSATWMFQQAQM